ncbi:phytanoyl-CoA dioxygenase family protein [Aerophototrophica crusticola]|uniref:Phytanoyl-CoA dioxygenase family protein n=1 Tax=Aerophototrophica crusticola TaxID=1709002 RepID=A0A858R9T6_9PROT|nr:phytanoyl-CoA dioxygenase family protein [Rhodospirillaceae bacterium B3]
MRATLFDKTPAANWKVAWHQDLAIAVAGRADVAGFGPWSVKDSIPHALAPTEVLERMVALRLHLDDCGPANGALRVVPGSHRLGRLDAAGAVAAAKASGNVACAAAAGDVLLMRPLLLHASPPAEAPGHRRVLHLDYAAGGLPGGLRWHADA